MAFNISLQKHDDHDDLVLFPDANGQAGGLTPDDWMANADGQLAVDVIDGDAEIVIRSPIAGVTHDDLEVFVHNDTLTIRGQREPDEVPGRTVIAECHWGKFSRTLILPSEIDSERIAANLKNGVLTIKLPKLERTKRISVHEEE